MPCFVSIILLLHAFKHGKSSSNIEEIEIYSKRAKKHANNNYFESDNKTHHSCKGSIHNVVVFSIVQMLCIQYEPGENKSFT